VLRNRTRSVASLCAELALEFIEIHLEKKKDRWCVTGQDFSRPEDAVFSYLQGEGFCGSACESGAIFTVLKACCLDFLVSVNTFRSEEDACNRYFEAQCTIHWDKSTEIIRAALSADTATVIRNIDRIFAAGFVNAAYPGINKDACFGTWQALSANQSLDGIIREFVKKPYVYRAGWPDLTLYRGPELLLVEVKTEPDRFHESQLQIIENFTRPLSLPFRVAIIVPVQNSIGTVA
jgi:VRR-NUC domain